MNKRRRFKAKARRRSARRVSRWPGWREDCAHWRGGLLIGRFAHWCPDWDGLPIDETSQEWPCPCEAELREFR